MPFKTSIEITSFEAILCLVRLFLKNRLTRFLGFSHRITSLPASHDIGHSDPNPKFRNMNKAIATLGACDPDQLQREISLKRGAFKKLG